MSLGIQGRSAAAGAGASASVTESVDADDISAMNVTTGLGEEVKIGHGLTLNTETNWVESALSGLPKQMGVGVMGESDGFNMNVSATASASASAAALDKFDQEEDIKKLALASATVGAEDGFGVGAEASRSKKPLALPPGARSDMGRTM